MSGMVCATLANVNRDTKKKKKPFEPIDFMVTQAREKKPANQRMQELKAALMAQNAEKVKSGN